jgi:hypothetical protein
MPVLDAVNAIFQRVCGDDRLYNDPDFFRVVDFAQFMTFRTNEDLP